MPELRMAALAVAFAAGILASSYVPPVALLLVAAAGWLLAVLLLRSVPRVTIVILAAVFLVGGLRYDIARRVPNNDISRHAATTTAVEGTISSDPEPMPDRVRFVLRACRARVGRDWRGVGGDVMVNCYTTSSHAPPALEYGDAVRLSVRPYVPCEPTNPSQFSWKQYLARHGIYTCASIRDTTQIERLPGGGGSVIVTRALGIKRYISDAIRRKHPREYASLIVGILLGTYSYLSAETFTNFSRTGTLHILAASGFNCYVLGLLSAFVLTRLRVMPKYRSIVIIGLLVLYLLMVGPKPSLFRASIMYGLFLLAVPMRRVATGKNVFFAAALIVLAIRPTDLFEVGFQLSFAAVWALISISPVLHKVLERTGLAPSMRPPRNVLSRIGWKLTGTIATAALATTAIALLTGPLVAYYFNYVSLVSIPANMALASAVPLVFIEGMAAAALTPLPGVGEAVAWIGTTLAHTMLAVVSYLGAWKYAAVSVKSPGVLTILGYYVILYALLNYVRSTFADKQSNRVVGAGRDRDDRDMDRGVPAP